MAYQVVVPRKVQKNLQKIDKQYRQRILTALDDLAFDPYVGKKLWGEHKSERAHRVWPYRIIYRVQEHKLVVLVIKIGHRREVYR